MIVFFFVGMSSNPTYEYSFYENIFLYFLFSYQPFQCICRNDTFTSAVRNVKKILWQWIKPMISHRLHAMHYNYIDLVVITTSSVYCDLKKKKNKQTDKQNIKLPNEKKQMKKKEKKKRINKNSQRI